MLIEKGVHGGRYRGAHAREPATFCRTTTYSSADEPRAATSRAAAFCRTTTCCVVFLQQALHTRAATICRIDMTYPHCCTNTTN